MITMTPFAAALVGGCALALATAGSPAMAQRAGAAGDKDPRGYVLMPGVMTAPGAIGPIGRRRLCDPRSVGLTQLRVAFLARLLKPNETQNKAIDELAAASKSAVDAFAAACPRPAPRLQTATAQFEMMEKRLDTASQAVRAVRPAFDAFYASLDGSQRAKVDKLGPKRSGWLW